MHKTLLIMRHAKSSWSSEGLADIDRPLSGRGKRDAPRMARWLGERDLVPGLILASPAKRTRSTAKRLTKACDFSGEVRLIESLYDATAETYLQVLADLQYEEHRTRTDEDRLNRVMVIGHNPTLEELVYELTGESHRMPTAAIAVVEIQHESWAALDESPKNAGHLVELALPREIDSPS